MSLMGHLLECEYSLILEEDEGVGEIHVHVPDLEKVFKSCICILPMISCRKRFYTSPDNYHIIHEGKTAEKGPNKLPWNP